MAYTDQAKVEGYLQRPLEDDEQALFDVLEQGVEDIIDSYCARSFTIARATHSQVDATTGDKTGDSFSRYDGGGVEIFFDQPLQTDTTLTLADGTSSAGVFAPRIGFMDTNTGAYTLIDPSEYVFYPLNAKKKTSVMRNLGIFPYGIANIFVYGVFTDYVTPPSGIQLAATIICADIINLPDGISQESIEGYSRTMNQDWNPTVQKILDIFRRVVL